MGTVAGTFENEETAQQAVQVALDRHFNPSQVSLLIRDEDGQPREVGVVHKTGVSKGSAIGAVLGAALGAIAIGPVALVGLGPALLLLEGAAAGAAAGTLTGALGGLGFWEDVADVQASDLTSGRLWVGIETENRMDEAEAALREAGALRVSRTNHPTTQS